MDHPACCKNIFRKNLSHLSPALLDRVMTISSHYHSPVTLLKITEKYPPEASKKFSEAEYQEYYRMNGLGHEWIEQP